MTAWAVSSCNGALSAGEGQEVWLLWDVNHLSALAAAEGTGVSTVVVRACLLGAWCGRMSREGRGTGFLWFSSQL